MVPKEEGQRDTGYRIRRGAEQFPMMVVISMIYPCNLGCPNCPYTDANSDLRRFYRKHGGDLLPVPLWRKMADECGKYGAWMRCTGGGEPMIHPKMVEMIEYAKERGARVWLNTNGTMFGPQPRLRKKLERIIRAGVDLIEFSVDAGDAETYAQVRPPRHGPPKDPEAWWADRVDAVRSALALRKEHQSSTRIVVSIIQQELMTGRMEDAVRFWMRDVEVDEVITRKFLSWDSNTKISLDKSLDPNLYADSPTEGKAPCVWPFERLNVDTLGRIALCGQDISFHTAEMFPNANDVSLEEIWQGEVFDRYRTLHLEGSGATVRPCRGCSAWRAGIRDWEHGWLKVLDTSADHVEHVMKRDLGVEVELYRPEG